MIKKELYLIGLNYKTAPVEIREAFALSDPTVLANCIIELTDGISEYLILSTCNRVEIIVVGEGNNIPERIIRYWSQAVGKDSNDLTPYIYTHKQIAAVHHLFTVASSLDSMVLGEPQILGQIKEAYRKALKDSSAKVIISRLMHKAFSTAKRVRSETGIASSAVSISYAAIELAKRIFDDMTNVRAMLIGAGEMAELAAAYLVNSGIESIHVTNRTLERAQELATRFNGEAIPFEALLSTIHQVDIIISSTASPVPVICAKDMRAVMQKRKHKPMFFIDIAVPRDIAPNVNNIDNVYLYDIDDLKEVVEENLANRREEAQKALAIVTEETNVFKRWISSLELQPTIIDFLRNNEFIAKNELEKTLKHLGNLTDVQRHALEIMMTSLVKKLSHAPLDFLKHGMENGLPTIENLSLFRRIFNLDNETSRHPCPGMQRKGK